jgi:hypothetical protein
LTSALLISGIIYAGGSKAYPLGCSRESSSFYDYDNYPFPPPGISVKTTKEFMLVQRLGTGKFSDVFSAVEADGKTTGGRDNLNIDPRSLVVIKVQSPTVSCNQRRNVFCISSHIF